MVQGGPAAAGLSELEPVEVIYLYLACTKNKAKPSALARAVCNDDVADLGTGYRVTNSSAGDCCGSIAIEHDIGCSTHREHCF
jgi:hypothetical protein